MLHFDGANDGTVFTDSSDVVSHPITVHGNTTNTRISNHPVTANGDAHIIGPKVGSSAIEFDGDGDGLTVAAVS